MEELAERVDEVAAATAFSGVVRVDVGGTTVLERAFGTADRRHAIPNTIDTRFAIASGVKGITALTVASLIEDGVLALDTPARSLLGGDLPLIDDAVTVEHLLAHRSGIGDYVDESEAGGKDDYVLTVPVHRLVDTEDYLPALDGHPTKFAPDARFEYCNGGFVVLALLAERATGTSFRDLVRDRVTVPAGMTATEFLRSDELDGTAAVGYLAAEGLRTNALHLPVRGTGDGGIYTTLADVHALWRAIDDGTIVSPPMLARLLTPRSAQAGEGYGYGLGFWLPAGSDAAELEGCDAGVSFRSTHHRDRALTCTVIGNTTDGAWPIARVVRDAFSA